MMSFGKLFEKVIDPRCLAFDRLARYAAMKLSETGSNDRHGPMQCQKVQSIPARHDHLRPSRSQLRCFT